MMAAARGIGGLHRRKSEVHSRMKFSLLCLLLTASGMAAESLNDFRWKKRLLVVTGGPAALRTELSKQEAGLVERDVRVFILNEPGKAPDKALAAELRDRLKIRDGVAEVLLLGKDGQTTLRWKADEFTIAALFAKIDAMPMRKAEMQGRASPVTERGVPCEELRRQDPTGRPRPSTSIGRVSSSASRIFEDTAESKGCFVPQLAQPPG